MFLTSSHSQNVTASLFLFFLLFHIFPILFSFTYLYLFIFFFSFIQHSISGDSFLSMVMAA